MVKKQQAQVDSELSSAQRQNEHLRESLQEAEQKLPELHKQLEDHKQAKSVQAVRFPFHFITKKQQASQSSTDPFIFVFIIFISYI